MGKSLRSPFADLRQRLQAEQPDRERQPLVAEGVEQRRPDSGATPTKPPARNASASRISESHSCAVHALPATLKVKGSTCGTARCASIQSPVAICDQVSLSLKMAGENAQSANIASASACG